MRLQSDIDALAAIEEDAKAMLKRIGLPDDAQKLEVVVFLRKNVDLATSMVSAVLNPSVNNSWVKNRLICGRRCRVDPVAEISLTQFDSS